MKLVTDVKYDDRPFAELGGAKSPELMTAVSLRNIDVSLRRIADGVEKLAKAEIEKPLVTIADTLKTALESVTQMSKGDDFWTGGVEDGEAEKD